MQSVRKMTRQVTNKLKGHVHNPGIPNPTRKQRATKQRVDTPRGPRSPHRPPSREGAARGRSSSRGSRTSGSSRETSRTSSPASTPPTVRRVRTPYQPRGRPDRREALFRSPSRDRNKTPGYRSDRRRDNHRRNSGSRQSSREGSRTTSRTPTRMSSSSRERYIGNVQRDMHRLNEKLAKAVATGCAKCGSKGHRSKQCRVFPKFSDTKCSCGLYHPQDQCNQKPFYSTPKN